MSQGYYPPPNDFYGPPPQQKSPNVLLIILGVFFGGVAVVGLVCCGGGYLLLQSPSASAKAKETFDYASIPVPKFESLGQSEERGSHFDELYAEGPPGTPGSDGVLYVWKPLQPAQPKSLPCVLVAPAGSTLMEGMSLSEGDQDEQWPYVREGFVVIGYSLDGGDESDDPYEDFKASRAGLVNARNALEYALNNIPEVDPNRIFAAGHSSAASHALLFAEHEPRLAGVAAYCPCVNIPKRIPGIAVRMLQSEHPGLADFLAQSSPHTHAARLNCPVFLFGAEDDDNTPLAETKAFANQLQGLKKDVTLETTPHGGHYQSMISEGIPRGIAWMKTKGK